jgi:hypothetical protein
MLEVRSQSEVARLGVLARMLGSLRPLLKRYTVAL